MEILKKYWWVFLIIILLIIGYYMWMKKKEEDAKKTPSKTPSSCNTVTLAVYNAKVADYIAAIEANSDWLTDVTADIKTGETLADAKRRHAQFMAENTDKMCKPAGA